MFKAIVLLLSMFCAGSAGAHTYSVFEHNLPADPLAPLSPVFVGAKLNTTTLSFATVNHPSFVLGLQDDDWTWEIRYTDIPMVTDLKTLNKFSANIFELAPVLHFYDDRSNWYFKFGVAHMSEHLTPAALPANNSFYDTFTPGVGFSYQITRRISFQLGADGYYLSTPGFGQWITSANLGIGFQF